MFGTYPVAVVLEEAHEHEGHRPDHAHCIRYSGLFDGLNSGLFMNAAFLRLIATALHP